MALTLSGAGLSKSWGSVPTPHPAALLLFSVLPIRCRRPLFLIIVVPSGILEDLSKNKYIHILLFPVEARRRLSLMLVLESHFA